MKAIKTAARKTPPIGADPTRDAAFALLQAVLHRHRPLDAALDALPPIETRDRTAAHRLAAAVLRRFGSLQAVLEPHLRRAPPPDVLLILMIGCAGLLLLDGPAHASVATSVDLTRRRKLEPFTGLVNAVLRAVARDGAATLAALDAPRLDTPVWLWQSWGALARPIAIAQSTEAPLDLSLRHGYEPPEGGFVLPNGSVRYPPGTRITNLPGFAAGGFWAQDAAAALPVRLLAPQRGERIADLCAAPGGKTAQLADAGAAVTALDRDAARLPRLRENLARLGLTVNVIEADALTWRPPVESPFDAVLLDAPCSATGTIRRHPDLPHIKRPPDVAAMAATQAQLLAAAAEMLRPDGRLIYAVCSMQPQEGQNLLETLPPSLKHDAFTPAELAFLPQALTTEGCVRTHPGLWAEQGGMDGFFIARFIRN